MLGGGHLKPRVPTRLGSPPVRVLVVTNLFPTARRPALGPFVRDQVEAVRALGDAEIELHSFDPPGGIRPYVREALTLARKYRGKRFDVVHAHYGLSGACSLAVRHGRHLTTFHGDDLRLPKTAPIAKLVVRAIDLPATVSANLARTTERTLGRPGVDRRVAVLPCGIDLDRLRPLDRRDARSQLGLDPDGRYLLFPADPARPEKRHDRARELADASGATLIHYDNTPPDRVPLYINAANAVIVTSEREGFGLAPLEALACNVPVLATDVGIAPLALAGIEGTLCAPFERERWREALAPHLASDAPRVEGRPRAALFGSRRMAERVLLAYRELAETS
jgi:teichuronic acid biosynthesis glycosyltransferase TuaC